MLPEYKVVNMPITVPRGKYCWEFNPPHAVCSQFSNEGGYSTCDLGFIPLNTDEEMGVPKPIQCRTLEEINEEERS